MLRKLAFLAATVYLGKRGYDALMASQTSFDDTSPSVKPLDFKTEPEVADQSRAAAVLSAARSVG